MTASSIGRLLEQANDDEVCESCGHTDHLIVKLTMWPDDPKPVSRVLCQGAMACNTRAGRQRATKTTP